MIHFDLPKEKSSIIKVIGVGGGGSNAVNHMFSQNIEGVNFIICNTDAQAIAQSKVPNKIQLGPHLTQGLGAGANPDIGRQATEESLEEIKQILEVNTKMAFITAGMGGGTGTGGAPIISKICKDLGILTVGIITTPFSYEGKKRQLQAEEGIRVMKEYVDTLLVISNDKLRHQFGNLKMKEAFAKADNVLATAAKCITDVITSTGQINVDFADVCTVMRNGGVAILGSATAKGDNRAQKAIEEALNSPLLNDNDIRGAKWILININSCEGENEFTMDEVEIIQNYLLSQAGEGSDVIMGLGYDNSLGASLGITLIATGFEHKDPFTKAASAVNPVPKKEEKIIMILGSSSDEQRSEQRPVLPAEMTKVSSDTKETPVMEQVTLAPLPDALPMDNMQPRLMAEPAVQSSHLPVFTDDESQTAAPRIEWVLAAEPKEAAPVQEQKTPLNNGAAEKNTTASEKNAAASATSGGYLARPSNIYAEENTVPSPAMKQPAPVVTAAAHKETVTSVHTPAPGKQSAPVASSHKEPVPNVPAPVPVKEPAASARTANPSKEEDSADMQLVFKESAPAVDEQVAHPSQIMSNRPAEEPATQDGSDDPKRRAAERINKLRNLSFNINAADPNNEFETVPAYIRRNLELYNTISNVENFYSNYEVKTDENNNTEISTINTFLDGKRPD